MAATIAAQGYLFKCVLVFNKTLSESGIMTADGSPSDVDRIEQIRQAFARFDTTGEVDVLAPHLADDVVFMPPERSPITGADAVETYLDEFPAETYEFDVDQPSEQLLVGTDLAVNQASVTGTKTPVDGEDSERVSHKGVDVFRKDPDGSWKVVISIWNEQA